MNETEFAVHDALMSLFSQDLVNWAVLEGIVYALSFRGYSRSQIMLVFWNLMIARKDDIMENQMDMIGDFCAHLLGRCAAKDIVRLFGDPESPDEFVQRVQEEASKWAIPTDPVQSEIHE